MKKILLPIPTKEMLDEIRPKFDAIYTKIRILTDESTHLAQLRDTLLPKLMNGEIEI